MHALHRTLVLACLAPAAAAGDLPLLPAPISITPEFNFVCDIELADLDGDGLGDLLATETQLFTGSLLTVRPGLGAGLFGAREQVALVALSAVKIGQQIATVDLDGDSDLDVIVAPGEGGFLHVLRNDGGFEFDDTLLQHGNDLRAVVTGDVNGDGFADAVVASHATNQILVFHGNGAGALQLALVPTTGVGPTSLVLADLDLDGWLDIASANTFDGKVGVLLAQGGGAFAPATTQFVGGGPTAIAAADLTGDGYPELIAGCDNSGLWVLPNSGNGLFGAPSPVPAADTLRITDILPADLDGDGKRDLVLGVSGTTVFTPPNATTRVLFGTGTGGFHATANSNYAFPDGWDRVALGQLGGDTVPDVLVSDDPRLVAFTGVGAALDVPPTLPLSGSLIALGDVTGDGNVDVLGTDDALKAITVRLGNGTDTLDASPSSTVKTVVGAGAQTFIQIDAADLDGDGDADPVAIIGNVAQPTLAQPDGSLLLPTWIPVGAAPAALKLVDLDGDSLPDMLTASSSSQVRVYHGLGSGQFTLQQTHNALSGAGGFSAGDVDADGDVDVAVSNGFSGVSLLTGHGDGTFTPTVNYVSGIVVTEVAVTDLDANGYADLLTSSTSGLRVSLHDNAGALLPPVVYANGEGELRLGDVDGDGRLDAVTSAASGTVGVFHANGDGTLQAADLFANDNGVFGVNGPQLAVGDLNADGDADVLVVAAGGPASKLQILASRSEPTVIALGGALAGTAGEPVLSGVGTLAPLTPLALHITQAAALAPTALILGFSELNAPIKGGVLVPNPDLQISGLITGPAGELLLNLGWPAGVPSGFSLWMQAWIVDAGGPKGLAATNGLRLDAP